MLTYRAAYRLQFGMFHGEVLDFPEASAFGGTLHDARDNLLSALRIAAERLLQRGELLPLPDPERSASDAYLLERLTLLPQDDRSVAVRAEF